MWKILVSVLFLILCPVMAFAEGVGIVAVVGDDIVSSTDVSNRVHLMALSSGNKLTEAMEKTFRLQALQALIDERLYIKEAARLKLKVSDDEIAHAIRTIEVKNNLEEGKIDTLLKQYNISEASLYEQIRAQLLWTKIVAKEIQPKIKVSDADVQEAMEHFSNAGGDKELLMSEIVLPVAKKEDEAKVQALAIKLVQQIRAGTSFTKMAKEYSLSPSRENGGKVGWIKEDAIPSVALAQIVILNDGQITDPIRTDKAYYIIKRHQQRDALTALQYETEVTLKQAFIPLADSASDKEQNTAMKTLKGLAAKIKTCKDFDGVVHAAMPDTSTDPLTLKIKDIHPDLQGTLAVLNVGDAPAVIRSTIGVHLVALCQRSQPATVTAQPNDAQKIRAILMQQKLELQVKKYLLNLRRHTMIEMRM